MDTTRVLALLGGDDRTVVQHNTRRACENSEHQAIPARSGRSARAWSTPGAFQRRHALFSRIVEHIKAGEYQQVLAGFNPEGVTQGHIGLKITYDLVNVLVHKQTVAPKELMCREIYEKYPNDLSYSVKICGLLIGYLEQGQLDPEKLKDLEEYFEKRHREKDYLLTAVKDLG